jgi:hypothetical protein
MSIMDAKTQSKLGVRTIEDPEELSYKNMRKLFFDLLARNDLQVVTYPIDGESVYQIIRR